MELIDRVNGFGKVMLTPAEQRMLGEIRNIASTAGRSYILGEMNEQTGRYERIMHDLFPMVPLVKSAGLRSLFSNSYSIQLVDESWWYEELPEGQELRMGSRFSIGSEAKNVELRVLTPSKVQHEGYFMSVVVGDIYHLRCVDDVVKELGKKEKLKIIGVGEIKHKQPTNSEYGIAQVPQLQTVLKLYEKSAHLLRHAEDTIHVSVQELHTLREDMVKHPNIALRKLSAEEYQKQLEALTRQ